MRDPNCAVVWWVGLDFTPELLQPLCAPGSLGNSDEMQSLTPQAWGRGWDIAALTNSQAKPLRWPVDHSVRIPSFHTCRCHSPDGQESSSSVRGQAADLRGVLLLS